MRKRKPCCERDQRGIGRIETFMVGPAKGFLCLSACMPTAMRQDSRVISDLRPGIQAESVFRLVIPLLASNRSR